MSLFNQRFSRFAVAAGALLILAGCKTTGNASGANFQSVKTVVENSLQDEDWEAGIQAIRFAPDHVDDQFLPWLKANADEFPPVYLYAMADRLFEYDDDDATQWFFSARVRHTYDLLRCQNSNAALIRLDTFTNRFRKTVVRYVDRHQKDAYRAAREGLDWDEENRIHATSPSQECRLGELTAAQASPITPASLRYPGAGYVKPEWMHPQLLSVARRRVAREVENIRRNGFYWDEYRLTHQAQRSLRKRRASVIRRARPQPTLSNDRPWRRQRSDLDDFQNQPTDSWNRSGWKPMTF